MTMGSSKRIALNDSTHTSLTDAKRVVAANPHRRIEVTVVLKRNRPLHDAHESFGDELPHERRHIKRADYTNLYGASPESLKAVRSFAAQHNLKIVDESPGRRTMVLAGTEKDISTAFGVEFEHFEHFRGHYHSPAGVPSLPEPVAAVVECVLGMHSRPVMGKRGAGLGRHKTGPRSILELARTYQFPENTDGSGECIGILEFGGGFYEADIEAFCKARGTSKPRITSVNVGGGSNHPAERHAIKELLACANGEKKLSECHLSAKEMDLARATIETTMDIEIVAALAPHAHIVVYFAPNDDQGVYAALTRAIHDEHHHPSVISISWGEPETSVSEAYIRTVEEALRGAAHLGITVCASSGDDGAINGSSDDSPTVNFPASSPHCLGCGGTNAEITGATLVKESAWNHNHHGFKGATGGGVSRKFSIPRWQQEVNVPHAPTGELGRGVPDVAGPADPDCGCEILVAGVRSCSAGTSAVAPFWAALIARCNQALGTPCGYLTPLLYRNHLKSDRSPALEDVPTGNNGYYEARPGWNPCTGLGTPRGRHLLQSLRGQHQVHKAS